MQVAAIGMDPYKHLGKDLASVQPHLTRLSRYVNSGCEFFSSQGVDELALIN